MSTSNCSRGVTVAVAVVLSVFAVGCGSDGPPLTPAPTPVGLPIVPEPPPAVVPDATILATGDIGM